MSASLILVSGSIRPLPANRLFQVPRQNDCHGLSESHSCQLVPLLSGLENFQVHLMLLLLGRLTGVQDVRDVVFRVDDRNIDRSLEKELTHQNSTSLSFF